MNEHRGREGALRSLRLSARDIFGIEKNCTTPPIVAQLPEAEVGGGADLGGSGTSDIVLTHTNASSQNVKRDLT